MTTKTLASSLAALAMIAAQGAVEGVWPDKPVGDLTTKNAVGFENFALGATPATSYDDSGTPDSSKAYFLYSGPSGDDQSVVTNHDNFAFNKIPNYFSTLDNNKYLSLSTEGGTLFRSINVIDNSGDTPALGQAEAIPDNGLFVDTLVQFTPCEEAPAFNDADQNKLAIWLNVVTNGAGDAVGTNLCVRAGYTYESGLFKGVLDDACMNLNAGLNAGLSVQIPISKAENAPMFAVDYAFRQTYSYGGTHVVGARLIF